MAQVTSASLENLLGPYGIYIKGKTILVTDPSSERVAIICPLDGTWAFF